jgi:hypothetical protein
MSENCLIKWWKARHLVDCRNKLNIGTRIMYKLRQKEENRRHFFRLVTTYDNPFKYSIGAKRQS